MEKLNLLQALCKANNTQGGTIHQYADILSPNYQKFADEYKYFCEDMSFECTTKVGFKKLAERVSYNGLKF